MNKITVCHQLLTFALFVFLFCFAVINAATLEFNVKNDLAITALYMGKNAERADENFFPNVMDALSTLDSNLIAIENAEKNVFSISSDSIKGKLFIYFGDLRIMINNAKQKVEDVFTLHHNWIETALKWSENNKDEIRKNIFLVNELVSKINKNNSDNVKEVIDAAQMLQESIKSVNYAWNNAKNNGQKQKNANEDAVDILFKAKEKLDEIIKFVENYKNDKGLNKLISHLEYPTQHLLNTVLQTVRTLHEESQRVNNFIDLAFEKYTEIETSIEKLKKDLIMYKEGKNPKIETQQKETKLQTTDQQQLEEDKSHVSNEVNDFENVQQSTIDKESETTTLVSENQKNSNEEKSELTTGKQEEKEQEEKEILESKVEEKQENLTPQQTREEQQNNNEVPQQVTQNTSNTQQLKQKLQSIFGSYDGTSVTLSFATVIYVSCFAPVFMFFATLVA